ncbi:hypothetical protein HanIR_Chr14g0677631 [Helianthus annuus]|nr:hypothetical protein HanIR_Chr14g0677631 [Helianthus annuus]
MSAQASWCHVCVLVYLLVSCTIVNPRARSDTACWTPIGPLLCHLYLLYLS